jgi:hypothetical protein
MITSRRCWIDTLSSLRDFNLWLDDLPSHKWLGYFRGHLIHWHELAVYFQRRGFVVRDLPWTADKLRILPPFEFENWAVIALGGIPNKVQVGDMGVDGRIYPVSSAATPRKKQEGELALKERWYPIQVKQKDKVGRPDIDSFEAMMMREDCEKGFFVSFDYFTLFPRDQPAG